MYSIFLKDFSENTVSINKKEKEVVEGAFFFPLSSSLGGLICPLANHKPASPTMSWVLLISIKVYFCDCGLATQGSFVRCFWTFRPSLFSSITGVKTSPGLHSFSLHQRELCVVGSYECITGHTLWVHVSALMTTPQRTCIRFQLCHGCWRQLATILFSFF